jgi:hypothetical protein
MESGDPYKIDPMIETVAKTKPATVEISISTFRK